MPVTAAGTCVEWLQHMAKEVQGFIKRNQITGIDFVASHGHTIHHQPDKGITVQIGGGGKMADALKIPVVNDFRTQDVALGGQGAPLVPIGDELLFNEFEACLNLGGFANVSFGRNEKRVAFDIGPANIVLNHICQYLNLAYDEDGRIAKTGEVDTDLLSVLNNLPYYELPIPKSLGIEWVENEVMPLMDARTDYENLLRTFVEHIAYQIGEVMNANQLKNVYVTGGGVFNAFLMERIRVFAHSEIVVPNAAIVNYKEALVFAFLGVLKWRGEINVLKSVTGAKKDHCSGQIHSFS
jgi:anhydro-N-acetylmuramic acid kinase